jgi:hypothetical protein
LLDAFLQKSRPRRMGHPTSTSDFSPSKLEIRSVSKAVALNRYTMNCMIRFIIFSDELSCCRNVRFLNKGNITY